MDEVIVCKQKLNQMETEICSICFCEDDTLLNEHVDWLACTMCSVWVHKNYVSAKDVDEQNFICSHCCSINHCQVLLSFVMTFFS